MRKLKALEEVISLAIIEPEFGDEGWTFGDGPGAIPDTVNGFSHLHQLSTAAPPDYTGRTTVPVLWDKARRTIVNNESSEIIRILNSAFEARLGGQPYLVGGRLTEADWRLFTTLVRFDLDYDGNFKCNRRRLAEYPTLWGTTRELYQLPGIAATVDADHIKQTYDRIRRVNPSGVVPKGPAIDFAAPHDRERIPAT